jgi:hypothetical protein
MAMMRWEPFEGLTALRREMDRLFEDFSHGGGALRFWERLQSPPWRSATPQRPSW